MRRSALFQGPSISERRIFCVTAKALDTIETDLDSRVVVAEGDAETSQQPRGEAPTYHPKPLIQDWWP